MASGVIITFEGLSESRFSIIPKALKSLNNFVDSRNVISNVRCKSDVDIFNFVSAYSTDSLNKFEYSISSGVAA